MPGVSIEGVSDSKHPNAMMSKAPTIQRRNIMLLTLKVTIDMRLAYLKPLTNGSEKYGIAAIESTAQLQTTTPLLLKKVQRVNLAPKKGAHESI